MAQVPATRSTQGGRLATRREHPLQQLRRDFDTLFGRMWSGGLAPFDQDLELMRVWDFDVMENDKEIVVRAEMPGFEENELDVQISNNVLTIRAEKEQKDDRQEQYRSFYRTVALPSGVNPEKVQATYHNGVLEIHIPRSEEARPRQVKIQTQPAQGSAPALATSGQGASQGAGSPATEKAQK